MPRPMINPERMSASGGGKSNNPFLNWVGKRKERRTQMEEEVSQIVINETAGYENAMIDKLSSIDFLHSKLPREVLEHRSSPNQTCGDLEYAAKAIICTLTNRPQTITMDIREMDKKTLELVLLFKQTVEQGDVKAAYAAKGALVRVMADIRSRIPQNQPELAKQFVEVNTKYLDQWITLVGLSQVADRTKQNLDVQRGRLQEAQKKNDANVKELEKLIREDETFAIAFYNLTSGEQGQNRIMLGEMERKVHGMMIERRMAQADLGLNSLLVQQQEMDLTTKEGQIEILYDKVASLPLITDPNLMNKFRDSVDELFKQLAESDAQIDETLKTMDDIDARLQQFLKAPGSLRAQETAAEEKEKFLEELRKRQEIQSGGNVDRAKRMREEMGILTEEELAERRKQIEREQQRQMEAMQEQTRDNEQERLVN